MQKLEWIVQLMLQRLHSIIESIIRRTHRNSRIRTWVENILQAHHRTCAPRRVNVSIKT